MGRPVLLTGATGFGGQYLAVIGDLATLRRPEINPDNRMDFPDDITTSIPQGAQGGKTVVWGGGSKGVLFSQLAQRAGYPVSAVIDINPAKQGNTLPRRGCRYNLPNRPLPVYPKGQQSML